MKTKKKAKAPDGRSRFGKREQSLLLLMEHKWKKAALTSTANERRAFPLCSRVPMVGNYAAFLLPDNRSISSI